MKNFVRLIFGVHILFALSFCWRAFAQSGTAEIPFELRDGFLWLKVTAPTWQKPLNFLLDSGAQVSVINTGTSRNLGLKGGRPVKVMGVGATTTGLWPQKMLAYAGGVELPHNYLTLDLGELSQTCTNAPIDGIIGADFFHGRIVELDYQNKVARILVEPPTRPGLNILPLKIRRCGMLVPVRINGSNPEWVRLDTGCVSALQWVTASVRPEQCATRMAVALSKISVPVTRTTITLGAETFENVATDLHPQEIFPGEKGILGNGLLSQFTRVTIDAKAGKLFLR